MCDSLITESNNLIYIDQKVEPFKSANYISNLLKDNLIKPLYDLNTTFLIKINYHIDSSIKNSNIIKCIQNNLTKWSQAFYYIGINIIFKESYNPSKYNLVFRAGPNKFTDQKINLINEHNDIIINFNSLVEWSDDKLYSNILISNIISHNLGHIFGLHHDNINESIMYENFDNNEINIEKYLDLDILRQIYQI